MRDDRTCSAASVNPFCFTDVLPPAVNPSSDGWGGSAEVDLDADSLAVTMAPEAASVKRDRSALALLRYALRSCGWLDTARGYDVLGVSVIRVANARGTGRPKGGRSHGIPVCSDSGRGQTAALEEVYAPAAILGAWLSPTSCGCWRYHDLTPRAPS